MNDNDMNEMIKKAQEMIKNNQVPDDLKSMATMLQNSGMNFNNSANSANSTQFDNFDHNTTNSQSSNPNSASSNSVPNIDMATLMKMQSIMSKLKSSDNDDMSKLLLSLKPYMRDEKKGKIDEYINLVKMGKMTQILETFKGNNNIK